MKQILIRPFRILALCWLMLALPLQAEEQTWKVNLKEADIRAFITQISDITGYTFAVDPRIKGKVTIISNSPMNKDAVYDMFLAVLGFNNAAAIPGEGGVIRIIQQNDAKQTADARLPGKLPSEQIVTRVIQIKNANATELVPILRPMVAKYGHLAGVAAANALIISDSVANIKRISRIIDELDSPSKYELEVVQLQEAWVGDMVKLLEELAPGELGKGKGVANKFSVVADQRSNRLILRGDEPFRAKMRELIGKLDQPSSTGGQTKVIRLKHADAEALADMVKGLMGDISSDKKQGATGGGGGKSEASVYADEAINALVIRAEPSLLQELESVIEQLDVRRAQVLIEAAIVELSDDSSNKLGVQWALFNKNGTVPGALTNFGELGLSTASVLTALGAKEASADGKIPATALPSVPDGMTVGIGDRNGDVSWGALVQALEGNAGANVLSTPKVITMDNQESSIIVGRNIPIITGQSTSTGAGTSNPFTTIERQDVGVKLVVTPSISEGDLVRLEIEQEISDVLASTVGADISTTKRQIKTNVLADNRETIILGGLIKDDTVTSESKVPLLGDIPWLGRLFRSSSTRVAKQNLLVFLRPTILRDKDTTAAVTRSKYDELWDLNLQIKHNTGSTPEEIEAMNKPEIDEVFSKMRIK